MKITRLETNLLAVPISPPVRAHPQPLSVAQVVVLRVHTDAGLTGSSYVGIRGYVTRTIKFLLDTCLSELVVGEDPLAPAKVWQMLAKASHLLGGKGGGARYAMAAIDISLWDIVGKAYQQPLWQLLGGHRQRVPAYGSMGWRYYSIDELLAMFSAYVERGFKAVKMQIGHRFADWREDIARVRAVREHFGDGLTILVDANQAWDVATAIQVGRALEDYAIGWLEEPVPDDDHQGSAKVAAALDIPVATGEYEYTLAGFRSLVEHHAADILQPDVWRLGISGWMKVAAIAEAWRLPLAPHWVHNFHVHLVGATPAGLILEYFPWFDDLFVEPVVVRDGYVEAPDRPGHGLEFREEAIRELSIE